MNSEVGEKIINASRELALSEIEAFGTPHLIHFEISEKKAIELAGILNADQIIVQTGIHLMDLKLGQAMKDGDVPSHVRMSVDAARDWLDKYSLDEGVKNNIINCIEAHHGDIPFSCIEAEICANADCYRFIHPKGFFVYLTMLGKRGLNFSECLTVAEKKMKEKYNILSLDICKKELENYYHTLKSYIADSRSL